MIDTNPIRVADRSKYEMFCTFIRRNNACGALYINACAQLFLLLLILSLNILLKSNWEKVIELYQLPGGTHAYRILSCIMIYYYITGTNIYIIVILYWLDIIIFIFLQVEYCFNILLKKKNEIILSSTK